MEAYESFVLLLSDAKHGKAGMDPTDHWKRSHASMIVGAFLGFAKGRAMTSSCVLLVLLSSSVTKVLGGSWD